MNPLIADLQDKHLQILLKDSKADAKISKVKQLAMELSELALKDDNCLKIMEQALATMSLFKYRKRILQLPLTTSKL